MQTRGTPVTNAGMHLHDQNSFSGRTLFNPSKSGSKISFQFWLLAGFLVFVFMTGGSSRADVQSLTILRPASLILCGIALVTIRREHLAGRKGLLIGFCAVILLVALHLVDMPLAWQPTSLQNFVLTDLDRLAVLQENWQPLTPVPLAAEQSLMSLAAPAAALLIAMQLRREELYSVLPIMIGLGALSGFVGLLQVVGSADSSLYLYRITNTGAAVGLFANRNHAALLLTLLFPLLAVFSSTSAGTANDQKRRQLLAAVIAIVLVPLILVTGSRAGLLLAIVGIGGGAFIYRRRTGMEKPSKNRSVVKSRKAPILAGLGVVCLGFLTIFFSRAEALERLFAETTGQNSRSDFWMSSIDLFWRYLPFGTGAGSFATAFQTAEPTQMLGWNYLNRAHNDWIETAVTFGLAGLFLMAAGVLAYLRHTIRLWQLDGKRRSVKFARMAGIAISMIALASIPDYPLRTPSMMCVLVLLSLWFVEAGREVNNRESHPLR